MKRIHIAIGVSNIPSSVEEYSARLGQEPDLVVPGHYALWRTPFVNFSIRTVSEGAGALRHLGWEDDAADAFTIDSDVNGIVWERFNGELQADEIREAWPEVDYVPR